MIAGASSVIGQMTSPLAHWAIYSCAVPRILWHFVKGNFAQQYMFQRQIL